MSKHTPGPWKQEKKPRNEWIVYGDWGNGDDDPLISTLAPQPEAEANARLIAAAPDLLYALQLMVSRECGCFNSKNPDWHSDKCFKDIALKAIAKAEGR